MITFFSGKKETIFYVEKLTKDQLVCNEAWEEVPEEIEGRPYFIFRGIQLYWSLDSCYCWYIGKDGKRIGVMRDRGSSVTCFTWAADTLRYTFKKISN